MLAGRAQQIESPMMAPICTIAISVSKVEKGCLRVL